MENKIQNTIIRLATKEDCQNLSKIKLLCWKQTYSEIYPKNKIDNFDYDKNANKFLSIIENEKIKLFVVEVDDKIVGYMSCGEPVRPYKDYKQEIGLLYLLKEFQGLGIGSKLFYLAKQEIAKTGAKEFFISCNKYNIKAQNFYLKHGGIIDEIDEDEEDRSYPQIKFIYKLHL